MASLSDLVRRHYNKCLYCDELNIFGECSKLGKNMAWYIDNDKEPYDCPKKRRKKEGS